jgi:hypothetical protein
MGQAVSVVVLLGGDCKISPVFAVVFLGGRPPLSAYQDHQNQPEHVESFMKILSTFSQ